jgi:serine O-acetyltransferase
MDTNFEKWLKAKKNIEISDDALQEEDDIGFLDKMKGFLFPGYVEHVNIQSDYMDEKMDAIRYYLHKLLRVVERITKKSLLYENMIDCFFNHVPEVDELIQTDLQALFDGDPAAKTKTEILLNFPGLPAIFIYRTTHVLYELEVPILPRALTEYAHCKTGIDIHPGAKIDAYFFIDHGTGIVIGETSIIGKHVKLYQGVTLGALSLIEGQKLSGTKRHPTVKDNVTIYSGASVFGGETIIGENTTLGSNVFITSSVEPNMTVTILGEKKHKE